VSDSGRRKEDELSPAERRKFVRIACPPDASVRLRAGTSARLVDVGLGGALVESPARIVLGAVHATLFVTPDIAFRAQGRIVRAYVAGVTPSDSGGTSLLYRAGLEFGQLAPAEAGTLDSFVTAALRSMPASTPAPAEPARAATVQFPQAWAVTRKNGALVAKAPHSQSYLFIGAPPIAAGSDLGERARTSMGEAGFSPLHGQPSEINGLPAFVGFYTGRLHDLGEVVVEAAHIALNEHTYIIAGVAPWTEYDTVRHDFFTTINSFGSPAGESHTLLVAPSSEPASQLATVLNFPAASALGSLHQNVA
jgi:hypothetical protein